jgi:hypothetical protein
MNKIFTFALNSEQAKLLKSLKREDWIGYLPLFLELELIDASINLAFTPCVVTLMTIALGVI